MAHQVHRGQPVQLELLARQEQTERMAQRAQPARWARLVQREVAVVHRLFQLSRWCGRLLLRRFRILPTVRLVVITLTLTTAVRFGRVSAAPTTLITLPYSTPSRSIKAATSLSETFPLETDRRKIFWSSPFPSSATTSTSETAIKP